jgi:hypothetical protein
LVGNVTGGPQSGPQQSIKRKNTKAAEKKYGGECNNISMFKRPNQNSIHADKESSEHQCPRGSPGPLSMFCHEVRLRSQVPVLGDNLETDWPAEATKRLP